MLSVQDDKGLNDSDGMEGREQICEIIGPENLALITDRLAN